MKGLSHARPKGVARIKTELIDLDLIRGSAFTKAKPQQGFIATTYLGIVRVFSVPILPQMVVEPNEQLHLYPFILVVWASIVVHVYLF